MFQVLQAATVWHQSGASDKVYSVQLLFNSDTKQFIVASQYGRRTATPRSAPDTYTGTSKWQAEQAYNALLQKKVRGSKGDAYNKTINPPIIPSFYGGSGYSKRSVAEELKTAKVIDALSEFFSESTEVVEQVKPEEEKQEDFVLSIFG